MGFDKFEITFNPFGAIVVIACDLLFSELWS